MARLQTLKPKLLTLGNRIQHADPIKPVRLSPCKRGYGRKWQEASKGYLRAHPLCQCPDCDEGRKRVTVATVVDHITPHKGNMTLFWDRNNWQALAKVCHDKKTYSETLGSGYR